MVLSVATLKHYGAFVAVGVLAFVVDASLLLALVQIAGLSPFTARIFAIATAMVVSWALHRRVTFGVEKPPSFAEFIRFVMSASVAALVNYAVFAVTLLARPQTDPFIALVFSTLIAAVVSYVGMRLKVFVP